VNIHRQRYYEGDVGRPKAEALADHIRKVNSDVKVTPLSVEFGPKNAEKIARIGDLILDGCDNMETRFVINDAAFKLGIPWVYGGAVGVEGMCALFAPPKPCFRCLFRKPPKAGSLDTCSDVGIINTLPASIAAMQVTMAIRWLLGDSGVGELTSLDMWGQVVQKVSFRQRKGCECCAKRRFEFLRPER
jgi:adenylyltransferase/sulfurtransferase